ncbi:uncharacterized protein LOC131887076 [Tigriopus californicus]|uniref:uncharacterized protein LOC131887076 n=1 Tax=Tigriopus californicus TaxID=6832 RepID=UPI0027D9FE23|nr:uncharacterized protein LOC131887076 [Tigriopus californicus]
MNGLNFDGGGGGGGGIGGNVEGEGNGSGSSESPTPLVPASHLESIHLCSTDSVPSSAATLSQLEPSKYIISHSGPMGTSSQQSTAAAFFARTRSKQHGSPFKQLNLLQQQQQQQQPEPMDSSSTLPMEKKKLLFDFTSILGKCPPPIPQSLLKRMELQPDSGGNPKNGTTNGSLGKVKVIMRVANSGLIDERKGSHFKLDKTKRQVTLFDPTNVGRQGENDERKVNVSAPKMFVFDGLFTDEDTQEDVASTALVDTITSVVHGSDGCLFCFGHASLGKSYTMIGSDESSKTLGVIPTAIAWLFRCIKEKKEKTSTRFSVRVSATEIGGPREEVKDLLANVSNEGDTSANLPAPSAYLPRASHQGPSQEPFQNMSELRCPSADKAGFFLDAALSARRVGDQSGKDSHFVYTLHVYQYSVDKSNNGKNRVGGGSGGNSVGNVIGGRSRLHLIDFGGCERMKTSTGGITLSALGHVILGIFNGQRHLPFRESPVTLLLKECLGSLSCQATMLAHISPAPSHYSETLHTTQLASRIHRMRRKKTKSNGGSGGGSGSGSSDEMKKLVKLHSSSSDFTTTTDPSSSEQSCDTVIYVGSNDDEGTDAEHPPVYLPNLNSGDNRGLISKVLRGSTIERNKSYSPTFSPSTPPCRGIGSFGGACHSGGSGGGGGGGGSGGSRCSTLDRKRQKSPLSPLRSPGRNSLRPGSLGGTPKRVLSHVRGGSLPRSNPKGKMPLHGKVAGYRQPPSQQQEWWIDSPTTSLGAQVQSGSQVLVRTMQKTTRTSADWSDQLYEGPSERRMRGSQPIYGFMDDHKKSMIQQWVECQTAQMQENHVNGGDKGITRLEHKNPEEPEPFAWLKAGQNSGDSDPNCKVLTQFKTAESSEDSLSDKQDQVIGITQVDVHHTQIKGSPQKSFPKASQSQAEEPTPMSEVSVPPSPAISSTSLGPEEVEARVEELLSVPDSVDLVDPDLDLDHIAQTEMQSLSFPLVEISKKVRNSMEEGNPGDDTQRRRMSQRENGEGEDLGPEASAGFLPLSCHEPRTITSSNPSNNTLARTETTQGIINPRSSSSAQESALLGAPAIGTKSISNGQPHSSSSHSTLSRRNERNIPEHIRSLDRLYSECEAMVESLKRQSRASSIKDEELLEGERPLSEAAAFVNDRGKIQMAQDDSSCSSTSGSEPDHLLQKQISSLDGQNLHFVNKRPGKNANGFEELEIPSVFHNEEFTKNFDQLAKLHDLYASVSSISAKSQSHLERQEQRRQRGGGVGVGGGGGGGGGGGARDDYRNGSCFSLGALMLNDPENANDPALEYSVGSSLCDINSLCSEPVRMFDYNDFFPPPPASLLVDEEDNLVGGTSISLSDLGLFNPGNSLSLPRPETRGACASMARTRGPNATASTAENGNTAESQSREMEQEGGGGGGGGGPERSDSPILEGIDHELAKYAKLKDLKQAYNVVRQEGQEKSPDHHRRDGNSQKPEGNKNQTQRSTTTVSEADLVLSPLRHLPDGASNPDLNLKTLSHKASVGESTFLPNSPSISGSSQHGGSSLVSSAKSTVLPRRSPGTGQSSSGSDHELDHALPLEHGVNGPTKSDLWLRRTSPPGTSPILKIEPEDHRLVHPRSFQSNQPTTPSSNSTSSKKAIVNRVVASVPSSPSKSGSVKQQKVPKFSRLFSSATKKISRSPLKIVKGTSSATSPTNTTSSVPNCEDKNSSEAIRCDKKGRSSTASASGSSTWKKRENFGEATPTLTSSSSPTTKATSTTTALSSTTTATTATTTHGKDQQRLATVKTGTSKKGSSKNAPGTSSSTKCSLEPIKSSTLKKQPSHAGRSTPTCVIPSPYSFPSAPTKNKPRGDTSSNDSGIHFDDRVRLRGRGAGKISHRRANNKHCKSSGYESVGLESERDSIESPTIGNKTLLDHPSPTKALTFLQFKLPPLRLVQYGEEYVKRLDCRARFNQFQKLKSEQRALKRQMSQAKSRLGADPRRWSYELHLEDSVVSQDKTNPTFVEAFEKETQILRKRVAACQSHVKVVTCFDVKAPLQVSTSLQEMREEKSKAATIDGDDDDDPSVRRTEPNQSQSYMSDLSPNTLRYFNNCCTTECESAYDIMLATTLNPNQGQTQESELF